MLLGGKLPENNNTYEKQKKHFDEFTLARRKEKKNFTFSGSVLMFEVPENIPEQIWTSSVSLFIFQLVQSLGWNNLSQQKHFFYLICYPESNDYMILFPKCVAGFMNTQVAPQWALVTHVRFFTSSNLQGSRCWSQTSLVQNLSMQFSLALVLEGKAHPQWTKDGK